MKRIILFVMASVALATACPAQPVNARGIARELVMELLNLRAEMELSDDQRTQIRDVVKSHKDEIINQIEIGRDAGRSMREAVEKGGPESAAAAAAADSIAKAARSRALLRAAIVSEIRPILTPDQRKLAQDAQGRIENMIDERLAEFGE